MRGVANVLDAGEQGRDDWSIRDVLLIDLAQGEGRELLFPTDCKALSLTPKSTADAVMIFTIQNPEGIIVTTKTPFVGYLIGPIYIAPYYTADSSGYSVQLIGWAKRPEYIPPTFLDTTLVGARNKFSV